MYQCSRAGASLNLQVRKRSKMRTNHPVVWYSIFYIVSCHCSESKQCVFTICFFFQKGILVSLVSAFFVSFQILSARALWNLNEQQGKRVYRRYIAISLHMRSLVNTAVHRWSNCVSISFYLLYLYWINGLNKLAYRCTESGQRTKTESVYHSKRDKQTM